MNHLSGPDLTPEQDRALRDLIDRTASGPPADLAIRIRDDLQVDLSTEFAGREVPHPFGKASGQLSCTPAQVLEDVTSGIAFIILKTVIAESPSAARSMEAWARRETRMRVERRTSRRRQEGWTVTWEGRGWHGTLRSYLEFCEIAFPTGEKRGIPVLPSVKYHLPRDGAYRVDEYAHTTNALQALWRRESDTRFWMEKDFSPTLAGDALADDRERILGWVRDVPGLMTSSCRGPVGIGMKLMTTRFDDAFQVRMCEAAASGLEMSDAPGYLATFNRLFDRDHGVAFGGWDLSDRNLQVLQRARAKGVRVPALSGTGNITSGRTMLDYARHGCATGQLHTFFQVPKGEYLATAGSRTARALHTLMLHPTEGLVPWLWHLAATGVIEPHDGVIRFRDAVGADEVS